MNAPFGAHHSLLVGQPQETLLPGLAHQVADHIARSHIEVEIGLDAAGMGMGRHRVPDRAGLEFRKAHLQLTGTLFQHVVHDELVDDAVVGVFHPAGGEGIGLEGTFAAVYGNELGLIGFVGRGRVQVELGRIRAVFAPEDDIFVPPPYIQGFFEPQDIVLSANCYDAFPSHIDDAQFPALQEISGLQGIDRFQFQGFGSRHRTTEDETVVQGISQADFIGHHHLRHQEALTEGFGVVRFHIVRMTGRLDGISGLCAHN